MNAAAVAGGDTIASAGNPAEVTFWRSCSKPFQVMPFLESGAFDALGWGDDELALACASHGGEPEHVALVERMLHDLGMEEGDLACGVQEPLTPRGVKIVRESGERPTRLHNNCSGKHTAMLARAHAAGWPTRGYERAEHPVHQSIFETVSRWTSVATGDMELAIDGCGVVVFGLSLEAMALSYARLACAARAGQEVPVRIVHAMTAQPFLVGGTDRFDSLLMQETGGRILCKIGAEGLHCAALLDRGVGIALKVEDGAARAQYPALIRLLQELDALPRELPPRLAEFARRPLRNTRNEIVGEVMTRAAFGFRSPACVAV